ENRVPRLSMNLLGSYFLASHSKFIVRGKGADKWEGETVHLSDFLETLNQTDTYTPIFYKLTDLHNVSIPMTIDAKNPAARKLAEALKRTIPKDNQTTKFTGSSRVLH